LEASMADCMAIFAPNANSFRRFRRNSYAPLAPAWAIDNRSVPIRVTAGPAASRHLEHRVSGADANPYLVVAAVLAGIEHGIDGKIEPSAPVVGDGYEQKEATLPMNWWKALEVARKSDFLRARLGDEFINIFLTVKEAECDRFFAEI